MPTKFSKHKPQSVKLNEKSTKCITNINDTLNQLFAAKVIQREKALDNFKQFYVDFIVHRNTFPAGDFQYLWILYHCWNFIMVECNHLICLDDYVKFKVLFDNYINNNNTNNYKTLKNNMFENIRNVYDNYWSVIPDYIKNEVSNAKRAEKKEHESKQLTTEYFLKKIKKEKEEDNDDFYVNDTVNNRETNTRHDDTSKSNSDIVFMNLSDIDDNSSDNANIPDSVMEHLIDPNIYEDDDILNNDHVYDNGNQSDHEIIFDDIDE